MLAWVSATRKQCKATLHNWHTCVQAMPEGGVAFYNAGETAGASQRHKHLQVTSAHLVPGIGKIVAYVDALSQRLLIFKLHGPQNDGQVNVDCGQYA